MQSCKGQQDTEAFQDRSRAHTWTKSPLVMPYSSFHSLLDSVLSYFVDDVGDYVHERPCSVVFFFFLIITSPGVGVKELPTSQNETGSVSGFWCLEGM